MTENETIIGEVRKNTAAVVRVSIRKFKGKFYINGRVWLRQEGSKEESRPTPKGLTVRPDVAQELIPPLKAAVEAAAKMDGGKK
jgi:hypothetical protein